MFLVTKLSAITLYEFTVKDSFAFAEKIEHQDSKLFMDSPDVDSLLTNIPLKESTNGCTNLLYNSVDLYSSVDVTEGINKSEFETLLSYASQESHFTFSDNLYKQKDGVALE